MLAVSDTHNWSPESLRRQFPILDRKVHGEPLHYLDNAATTFSPECVHEAMSRYENHYRSNVQRGVYQLGVESTEAYEEARNSAAKFLNATSADEIIFTSGTTFSVNLIAYCLSQSFKPGDEIVVSVAEHHSNFIPWQRLREQCGVEMKLIPVLANGSLDLSQLDTIITDRCRLVAVSHISNVTGSITDLKHITGLAHRQGALVFVDGAQATPHGPVDVQALNVDFYAFSGHKSYGPTGVGVLWGRRELLDALPPFLTGGGMIERVTAQTTRYLSGNRRFEAGTPPIAQVIGLGAALDWLMALPWQEIRDYEQKLSGRLLAGLLDIQGLRLLGEQAVTHRAPIFSFDIESCHSHDVCQILDDYGVALRGGHHCAQPLMDALGLVATSRASIAVFNNESDIDALLVALNKVLEVLR
ncbi:MAG: SufS family cysteine desulfurase [Proteobacteria bacterium]|nr:SufS family cysteine desulfurase [Pseudomonadota bacterium]